ncbi:unnamed protein product, partial [Phaeothamnion confervicola]
CKAWVASRAVTGLRRHRLPCLGFVEAGRGRTALSMTDTLKAPTETPLDTTGMTFGSKQEHWDHLCGQGALPKGFSVGTAGFGFAPAEVNKQSTMNVTVIALDEPSKDWAAVFTLNKFPGAPVIVGRDRLKKDGPLQGIVINNKISNVCPGGGADAGVGDAERVCARVAELHGFAGGAEAVLPSSTGVIGWRLPTAAMLENLPLVRGAMQRESLAPAARSIMTTDRCATGRYSV